MRRWHNCQTPSAPHKWLKWVTAIDLVAEDYKGHYEGKRGWSDGAIRGQSVT